MSALDVIADWPVPNAAAAVVKPSGVAAEHGDTAHRFALASVTKPLVARAVQIAIEEGVVELDTPRVRPIRRFVTCWRTRRATRCTTTEVMSPPGKRRIYSNYGFGVAAEAVEREADIEFGRYLAEAVFEPLGMASSELEGGAKAAGYGGTSTVADLAVFAADLLRPSLVSAEMHDSAIEVQFPGLDGVLPGLRRAAPQRLGPWLRDPRREVAALDRFGQLRPHLRAFWPVRDVHLGRSRP